MKRFLSESFFSTDFYLIIHQIFLVGTSIKFKRERKKSVLFSKKICYSITIQQQSKNRVLEGVKIRRMPEDAEAHAAGSFFI